MAVWETVRDLENENAAFATQLESQAAEMAELVAENSDLEAANTVLEVENARLQAIVDGVPPIEEPPPPPPSPTVVAIHGATPTDAVVSWNFEPRTVGRNGTDALGSGPWTEPTTAGQRTWTAKHLRPGTAYVFTVTAADGTVRTAPYITPAVGPGPLPLPPTTADGPRAAWYYGALAKEDWVRQLERYFGIVVKNLQEYGDASSWDGSTFPAWQRDPWRPVIESRNATLTYHVPLNPGSTYETADDEFRAIDAGQRDAQIRELGRRIKAMGWHRGRRIRLVFGWEWNGNWFNMNVGFAGSVDLFVRVVKRWIRLTHEELGAGHDVEFATTSVHHGNLWLGSSKVEAVEVFRQIGNRAVGGIDAGYFNLYNVKYGQTISGQVMFDDAMSGSDGIDAILDELDRLGVRKGITELGTWAKGDYMGGSGDDEVFFRLVRDVIGPRLHLVTFFDVVGPEGNSSQTGPASPYPKVKALVYDWVRQMEGVAA
jgi:hypothetical protein